MQLSYWNFKRHTPVSRAKLTCRVPEIYNPESPDGTLLFLQKLLALDPILWHHLSCAAYKLKERYFIVMFKFYSDERALMLFSHFFSKKGNHFTWFLIARNIHLLFIVIECPMKWKHCIKAVYLLQRYFCVNNHHQPETNVCGQKYRQPNCTECPGYCAGSVYIRAARIVSSRRKHIRLA